MLVTLSNAATTALAFEQTGGCTAGFSSRGLEIRSDLTLQGFWTYLKIAIHQLTYRRSLMQLEGKIAFITGAATGVQEELMRFGGATARLFVRKGAKVVLTDVNDQTGLHLTSNATTSQKTINHHAR
jgi:hypothetical protein